MDYIREDGKRLHQNEKIWCDCCEDYYKIGDLEFWNDDGACRPRLICPGCDNDLIMLRGFDDDPVGGEW